MAAPSMRSAIRAMERGMGVDGGWVAFNTTTANDTTARVIKAAPGAGKRLMITDIIISNSGSAGLAIIEDSDGTDLMKLLCSATTFQAHIPLRKPMILPENKGLSVVGFSSSGVIVNVTGFTIDSADLV